jgi:hypothetical protein
MGSWRYNMNHKMTTYWEDNLRILKKKLSYELKHKLDTTNTLIKIKNAEYQLNLLKNKEE